MPFCNGTDRGCNITLPRKRADFPLVWHHERTWQTLQGATQICRQRQRLLVRLPTLATGFVCSRRVS